MTNTTKANNTFDQQQLINIQENILSWYKNLGRKNLPWQIDNTPYTTWVSEIMLQQTQVLTVIPKYIAFKLQFPTLSALANANIDQVLHLWSGLGYYNRAKNMHRAAAYMQQHLNAKLPQDIETLMTLPGIGLSTANAIRALAFNQPATIVDGNIKRVVSRLHAVQSPINQAATEKTLWSFAQSISNTKQPKWHNQAMMDIGALICTTKNPKCTLCPVQTHCKSHKQQLTEYIPQKIKRRKKKQTSLMLLIHHNNQHILLEKRPENGIWPNLYCPPVLADKKTMQQYRDTLHIKQKPIKTAIISHQLTHINWTIELHEIKLPHLQKTPNTSLEWFKIDTIKKGIPKPVQTALNKLCQ